MSVCFYILRIKRFLFSVRQIYVDLIPQRDVSLGKFYRLLGHLATSRSQDFHYSQESNTEYSNTTLLQSQNIQSILHYSTSVSYTHLDVYKRQYVVCLYSGLWVSKSHTHGYYWRIGFKQRDGVLSLPVKIKHAFGVSLIICSKRMIFLLALFLQLSFSAFAKQEVTISLLFRDTHN